MEWKNGVFPEKIWSRGEMWSLAEARLVDILRSFEAAEHF